MALAQQQPQANLMADGLKKLLHGVADLRLADDADDAVIDAIQDAILAPIRGQVDEITAMQPGGGPSTGSGGLPPELAAFFGEPGMDQAMQGGEFPMDMVAAMNPALSTGGGGVPGLRQNPSLPNPDEFRRVIGAAQGGMGRR